MGLFNNASNLLYSKIIIIPALLIAFTFHEYAHALIADKLGDKTPRFQGRLTLNPAAHIDPVGFILAIFFIVGWAKPVQTNPSAYKNRGKDDLKVSLAGPIANFLVAIVASIVLGIYVRFTNGILPQGLLVVLQDMIIKIIFINVSIGLFNLIPVPPLDGFSILRHINPKVFYEFQEKFYQYQMLILVGIIFIGGRVISVLSGVIGNLLLRLAAIILYI